MQLYSSRTPVSSIYTGLDKILYQTNHLLILYGFEHRYTPSANKPDIWSEGTSVFPLLKYVMFQLLREPTRRVSGTQIFYGAYIHYAYGGYLLKPHHFFLLIWREIWQYTLSEPWLGWLGFFADLRPLFDLVLKTCAKKLTKAGTTGRGVIEGASGNGTGGEEFRDVWYGSWQQTGQLSGVLDSLICCQIILKQ